MLASIDVNGLSVFAEAGLVVFLIVFVAVTVRALRAPAGEVSEWARMPLEEGASPEGDAEERGGAA